MWLLELPDQLSWRDTGRAELKRPKAWRAPSWSWASVDGKIQFEQNTVTPRSMFSIIDCQLNPRSQDVPFGQVAAGFLRVRGRVLKRRPIRYGLQTEHMDLCVDRFSDSSLLFDVHDSRSRVMTTVGIETWDDPVYCLFFHVVLVRDARYKLGLCSKSSQHGVKAEALEQIDIYAIFCLALRKLPSGDFHRVGLLEIEEKSEVWRCFEAFKQAEQETIRIV